MAVSRPEDRELVLMLASLALSLLLIWTAVEVLVLERGLREEVWTEVTVLGPMGAGLLVQAVATGQLGHLLRRALPILVVKIPLPNHPRWPDLPGQRQVGSLKPQLNLQLCLQLFPNPTAIPRRDAKAVADAPRHLLWI